MGAAITCGECDADAALVTGAAIYPHRPDLDHKRFWRCVKCGAYVGCHPDTVKPLGRPAGPETRAARSAAHAAFDPIWKAAMAREGCRKGVARGTAYGWLALQLGVDPADCHIGMMDAATARRVVEVCAAATVGPDHILETR